PIHIASAAPSNCAVAIRGRRRRDYQRYPLNPQRERPLPPNPHPPRETTTTTTSSPPHPHPVRRIDSLPICPDQVGHTRISNWAIPPCQNHPSMPTLAYPSRVCHSPTGYTSRTSTTHQL